MIFRAVTIALILIFPMKSTASYICEQVGREDGRGSPDIFVDGDKGAFSYTAYNGIRQVLSLNCGSVSYNDKTGVVCSRVHVREDGTFTTDHYLIAEISSFTNLIVTTVAEGGAIAPNDHTALFEQYTVSCEIGRTP